MEFFELCNPGANLSRVFAVLKLYFDNEDFGRAA